jgi:hypothetical protein
MKKVLIFGAGSIGNHMANACIKQGLDVFVTDKNKNALLLMKKEIFPNRYGAWNNSIKQINFTDVFKLKFDFDLIILGTPPETHYKLYYDCLKKIKFKRILIEKPISHHNEKYILKFEKFLKNKIAFCGYNHSISKSFIYFFNKIKKYKPEQIHVNWCESWKGILGAHFWLKDEYQSYLGDMNKGGGALQEHSHGLHLLILILRLNKLNTSQISLKKLIIKNQKLNKSYDSLDFICGKIKNLIFTYKTDLLTFPAEKKIRYISGNYKFEWVCNSKSNEDLVSKFNGNKLINSTKFKKTRSSEFENEIKHIMKINSKKDAEKSFLNPVHAFHALKIIKSILN